MRPNEQQRAEPQPAKFGCTLTAGRRRVLKIGSYVRDATNIITSATENRGTGKLLFPRPAIIWDDAIT